MIRLKQSAAVYPLSEVDTRISYHAMSITHCNTTESRRQQGEHRIVEAGNEPADAPMFCATGERAQLPVDGSNEHTGHEAVLESADGPHGERR